jgi:DGQHR domain-containing protein
MEGARMTTAQLQKISVIVPENPFVRRELKDVGHCLAALNVEKLMEWWPGKPHAPDRDAQKVRDIQRFLDWKRVAQIAAYLLQTEIIGAPTKLDECFQTIYEPKRLEPGRQWPPNVPKSVRFERSAFPTFSNVLLHVNGARIERISEGELGDAAKLIFDEEDKNLRFSVIDGQHRINGAYFALHLLRQTKPIENWEIPSEIFINLDKLGAAPRHQAQIFIDVNFNQKKVDRSLVADLFPTARGKRDALDEKERAQDIGRRLMLETGPLKGMIQIPGIKYGVQDVVTLATLNSAIEDVLKPLDSAGITGLEEQTDFLAQCLDAWLEASGRKHDITSSDKLDPQNVVYQGRVLVSVLTLVPACLWEIRRTKAVLASDETKKILTEWFQRLMSRAGLFKAERFIPKGQFKKMGFLGSGGIGRFRDTLWAASISSKTISRLSAKSKASLASANKAKILSEPTK